MRKWIGILSMGGMAVSLYLVINEFISAGFCPRYPFINVPACYLVLCFFILIFVSRFIYQKRIAISIYYIVSIAGTATATWFSANHLIGNIECPLILELPLCFVALLTFLVLLILGLTSSNDIGRSRS